MKKNTDVFISYSHQEDSKWLDMLNDHLKPIEDDIGIEVFTDRQIKSGEVWNDEIKAALKSAKVFILLLTPSFFSSDFIKDEELPDLLRSIEENGAVMLSLIVRKCRFSRVEKISKFQSINPPSDPLISLEQYQIDEHYDNLATRIEDIFSNKKKEGISLTNEIKYKIVDDEKEKINEAEELRIRREYDGLIITIKVLKKWIENTFSEWSDQEDGIYKVDTRIKDLNKVLTKVLKKKKTDESFDLETIKKHINDIIAARIVVYNTSIIYNLHFKIMSHQRLNIESVIMHYRRGDKGRIFEDITEDPLLTDEIFTEEPNDHGYQGIHYIIKPNPVDDIHINYPSTPLYNKFELQIRTLLQHAWSEVEHRMVYKNNLDPHSKDIYRPQFSIVASLIKQCDELLDNLSSPISLVESAPADEKKSNPLIKNDVKKITDVVKVMQSSRAPSLQNRVTAKQFSRRNGSAIENIENSGFTDDKMQLGEFYLRGQLIEEAYKLYQELLTTNLHDKWIYLRFAESSDANAKEKDVLNSVENIYRIIINNNIPDEQKRNWSDYDHTICSQASVLAWKYNKYPVAIKLSRKAIELSKDTDKYIRYIANHLYFHVDISYENNLLENGKTDYSELLSDLLNTEIVTIYQEIVDNRDDWTQNILDTMAWYQYSLALCFSNSRKKIETIKHINLAVSYMERCEFNYPNQLNILQTTHKSEILSFKRKVTNGK